jgi:hypothetical protein
VEDLLGWNNCSGTRTHRSRDKALQKEVRAFWNSKRIQKAYVLHEAIYQESYETLEGNPSRKTDKNRLLASYFAAADLPHAITSALMRRP